MTTTRLARAGRSRFFIVLGILIFMVGFIALFNNSQQQLEESNMLRLRCEQQHDALNSRLQAIVDHKFRLEKSLENERKEHLVTKQNLELKAKEEKSIHSKQVLDAIVRLESSQQHYKILQTKHSDLVENCSKTKHTQSEQINGLEGKLNSLQNQLQLIKTNQDKELEEWKMKYQNLINDKNRLENLLKVPEKSGNCTHFTKLLEEYKANCSYKPDLLKPDLAESVQQQPPKYYTQNKSTEEQDHKSFILEKSFKEQQLVSKDLYKIPISIINKTSSNLVDGNLFIDKSSKNNSINNNNNNNINNNNINNKRHLGAIINSVENFQIAPKPIMNNDDQTPSNNNNNNNEGFQQPPPLNQPSLKLSTSTKASDNIQLHDDINKRALPIANVASPSSEKYKITSSSINTTTPAINPYVEHVFKPKQFPKGVAPIPENFDDLLRNDETNRSDIGKHAGDDTGKEKNDLDIVENKNSATNNRYANVVNDFSNNGADNKKDNFNDFNMIPIGGAGGEHLDIKDNLQEVLVNLNNAGEDDQNNNNNNNNFFDMKVNHQNNDMNDNVEVIGQPENDNIILHNKNHRKGGIEGNNNKLINEIVGDQGKEQAFPDGMHLEEPNEEDEDEDDYSNPAARKQEGAAIRN